MTFSITVIIIVITCLMSKKENFVYICTNRSSVLIGENYYQLLYFIESLEKMVLLFFAIINY